MQSDDPPTDVGSGSGVPAPSSALLRSRSSNANPDPVNRNDSNAYISPSPSPSSTLSALRATSSVLMSASFDATPPAPTATPPAGVTSSPLLNKLYSTQSVTAAARPRSLTMSDRSRPPVTSNVPPPSPPPQASDPIESALDSNHKKSNCSSQLPLAQVSETMANPVSGITSPLSPALPVTHASGADPREVQRHHVESTRRSKEGLAADVASSNTRSLNGEPMKKSMSISKLPVKKSSSLVNVVGSDDAKTKKGKKPVHEGVTRTWYLYLVVPLIAALWAGLAVILTAAAAIATNLSNLVYSLHASPALLLAATVSTLTYLCLILSATLSLTRTTLRLMTWFWTLPSRFGQAPAHPPTTFPHWTLIFTSPHKSIPHAVDVAVDRITSCVWAKIGKHGMAVGGSTENRTLEEVGKVESVASMYSSGGEAEDYDAEDDDEQALLHAQQGVRAASKKNTREANVWCSRYQLRTIVQLVLLLAVGYYKMGIPILFAVSHLGLVNTLSTIAACLSLGSAGLIVLSHILHHAFKFAAVARQLWAEPDDGKRMGVASASLGMDQGGGVGAAINRWIEWALATVATVVVIGLTFYRYPESPLHFFALCSFLVLLACLRIRSFVFRSKPSHFKSAWSSSAANASVSSGLLRAIFLLRSVLVVVALTCAVVHDLGTLDMDVRLGNVQLDNMAEFLAVPPNPSNLIVPALLFLVTTMGQDAVFAFSNIFTARLSAFLLVSFMVMRVLVFVAVLATPYATSVTVLTIAGLFLLFLNIDTRNSSRDRKPAHGSLHRRVLFNASIVATIVGVWTVSMLGVSNLSVALQEPSPLQNPRWPVLPRERTLSNDLLCNYHIQNLKLLDLVSLAAAPMAASHSSAAAIMEWVNQNPSLRGTVQMEGAALQGEQEGGAAAKDTEQDILVPFVEFRLITEPQTSVLVVRGTKSFGRASLHARILWSTAWYFSASSPFGTLFKLWPDDVATLVVSHVHKSLSIAYMPQLSGLEVITRMMQDRGRNVIIVGHGYAGAVAQVIGARLSVPAFATSAPGLKYFRHVFGLMGSPELQRWAVNLVPERDAVPTLDKQVGTTLALSSGCYSDEEKCHDPKELVTFLLDRCYFDEFYRNENRNALLDGQAQRAAPETIGKLPV